MTSQTTPAEARGSRTAERMRDLISASHQRSTRLLGTPNNAHPELAIARDELAAWQADAPLAPVYDLLDELVVQPARESGLVVALANDEGRLLWVDGAHRTRGQAEDMGFVAGADWSEAAVGTSAPGTAIAADAPVQVEGEEHFAPAAHGVSCTAVPIHDPATGRILGVLDVTGDRDAAAPHTLALLRAAVAASEAELQLHRIQQPAATRVPKLVPPAAGRIRIRLLGRANASIETVDGRSVELSPRHSEILMLLAWHRDGLSAAELAGYLHPEGMRPATLRAEMVRLRQVLATIDPTIELRSQPYRLDDRVSSDAADVLRAIGRGAHRQALHDYVGAVLPASDAPGVVDIREITRSTLREAVLTQGSPDAVVEWLELPGHDLDVDAHFQALRLLPPRSPKRAAVVARLESLEGNDVA
ncbi:helix-turn-helix domain-containing protein [Gulosibacter macacae]|nr:helix-turn-helix domain-containing protein [Gulosibacter macacae]